MSRLHLSLCLMMVFAAGLLASCSNDTDGDGALCVTKEDCEPDQRCKDSACISVSEAKLNEPCDETVLCVEPLACRDNVCVEAAVSCKTKDECPNDLVCRDGVCIKTDGSCKTKDECPNDLVCRDGVCVEADASCKTKDECPNDLVCRDSVCIKTDGACKTKDECPNDLVCLDNVCVDPPIEYAKEGESCMNLDCEPGTECSWLYVCQRVLKRGEACEIDDLCTDLDQCVDGFCKGAAYPGDLCDANVVCYGGTCRNGVCLKNADLFEPCHEDDGPICSSSLICVDRQCVKLKGDCDAENPKCNGDSYCCLEASCGEHIGKCVPYNAEGHDKTCRYAMKSGIFEASVQCYWQPKADETPASVIVYNTPISGRFHRNDGKTKSALAFITDSPTLIRIIDSETCEGIETIPLLSSSAYNTLAAADFDGDGYLELVTYAAGISLFKWDEAQKKHIKKELCKECGGSSSNGNYSIHDLDNDGIPEIIATNGIVYHADGTALNTAPIAIGPYTSLAIGDFDADGNIELLAERNVYRWNNGLKNWDLLKSLPGTNQNIQGAYADFGTSEETSAQFDFTKRDGKAELVLSGGTQLEVFAVFDGKGLLTTPQQLMSYTFPSAQNWGYPLAIADFNGDGMPEMGVAYKAAFGVYDPKCTQPEVGKCSKKYVIWESPTQDGSGIAGASAFDFDSDGQVEIVYGDECYTRVYDGKTGEVLFSSYRTSGTVIEYPTIADVDGDGSTEIVVASDNHACGVNLDPSHRGVKCTEDSDCYSKNCQAGLCRCASDAQCNWQTIAGKTFEQYSCTTALPGDTGGGNVCRAKQGSALPGVTVLRDRLDRWASSREIWNQHAYNITNINDNGSVPKTSEWLQNFLLNDIWMNSYRMQQQGGTNAGAAPDITGRFISSADVCKANEQGQILISAQVCNRGTKAVGRQMPAVFYEKEASVENILCVSYTDGVVPVRGCKMVSCEIDMERAKLLAGKKILLLVNDDGKGGKTTVECREDNNTDEITIEGCAIN